MKLIVILFIIMTIIFLVTFIIIFFLKLKKNKIKSSIIVKDHLRNQNSSYSNINNAKKLQDKNDSVNNKKVWAMLTYLQEKDSVYYNSITPNFYSIFEKPIENTLETNKNVNYLLTDIFEILCNHHQCIVNPLHLLNHLFNKCNNKLEHHQKCPHFSNDNSLLSDKIQQPTCVFNKIDINTSNLKTNFSPPKEYNKHNVS